MEVRNKYVKLLDDIKKYESAVVAFSGGTDSTFLLKACKEALGEKVMAVTIEAPYIMQWEIEEAKELAKEIGICHEFIKVDLLSDIKFNPKDRCYLCKKSIFQKITEFADKNGYNKVFDGTNIDDTKDYRPGIKALRELNVVSPLLESGFTKEEVRLMSKALNLETWDKPAFACLLSRIPYENEITKEELERIEKSEKYIMGLGFKTVRVRSHGNIARIEVYERDLIKILKVDLLKEISNKLKGFGYNYVTLDMDGYRMGSQNETI